MTRGNYDNSKNYLRAKLENFGKGNDTPFFNITKWNWTEAESIWQWAFVEWALKHVSAKDTQYWTYVTLDIEDEENNSIQWWMKLGQTMRNILFKLYSPASKNIKIKKINLKTGVYNDKKYVSILIDGERYQNPFLTRDDMKNSYDISPEVTEKIRVIKDPETWEVIKKDETKLDERVIKEIIPTINWALEKEWDAFWSIGTETKLDWTPIADTIKETNKKEDEEQLPFN